MAYPGQGDYSYGGNQYNNNGGYGQGYQQGPPPPGPPPGGFYGPPPPGPLPGQGYGGYNGYDNGNGGSGYNQGGYGQGGYGQGGYGQGGYGQGGGYPGPGYNNSYQQSNAGQFNGRYSSQPQQQQHHHQQPQQQHQYNNGNYRSDESRQDQVGVQYQPPSNLQRPPTNQQQFGNGAPGDYNFQYSNCQGKRKALLIGINYIGQQNELKGCINDVHNIAKFLNQRCNYQYDDMVILTDDQTQKPRSIPTRANMISAMQWLVKNAQPNDALFFHYSGHGGQTKDLDGDEEDGYDEVIYPVDYQQAGHLVDDDMHDIMVRPLAPGVRLTAIFDSCHSGTALDLPYLYSTQGVLKEPNLAKEAGMGLLSALSSYSRGDIFGAINSVSTIFKQATSGLSSAGGNDAAEKTRRTKTSPADVIMFSGCKDSQTSADTTENGMATGAMSYAFIAVLGQNPTQSYLSLLQNMRALMQAKYTQKPQLSASHPIDTNLQFVL
ncbi:caspase domain-containing protein [Lipomyces japonicus]|uniref:caspase domain-containing protein n=1 Tax=Lipomyces japonicus TaxID=56871 RepID=UPI0034CF7906